MSTLLFFILRNTSRLTSNLKLQAQQFVRRCSSSLRVYTRRHVHSGLCPLWMLCPLWLLSICNAVGRLCILRLSPVAALTAMAAEYILFNTVGNILRLPPPGLLSWQGLSLCTTNFSPPAGTGGAVYNVCAASSPLAGLLSPCCDHCVQYLCWVNSVRLMGLLLLPGMSPL